jgi:cell division protease FtsH
MIMAHAVVHFTCKLLPPLYQVSILPRNQSLGTNMLLPKEDAHIKSKDLRMEQLCMLMGGRAAESLCFDTMTNGAAGDMSVARDKTTAMVCEWGGWEQRCITSRNSRPPKPRSIES